MTTTPTLQPDRVSSANGAVRPFVSSQDHLWAELGRIDQLVRAQLVRWRMLVGASKPAHLWGMLHVTDDEVAAYLKAPYRPPGMTHPALDAQLAPYAEQAAFLRDHIRARQQVTLPSVEWRLDRLQALLALSDLARDSILICLLPTLDERYRRLYGYLQDDVSRTSPSVELIGQIMQPLVPDPAAIRRVFDAAAPLVAAGIVTLHGEGPLPLRAVHLDERIIDHLLGSDDLDAHLTGCARMDHEPVTWEQLQAEPGRVAQWQAFADWLAQQPQCRTVVSLYGPAGSGKHAAARAICTARDLPLLTVDVRAALHGPENFATLVTRAFREAALHGAAIYWHGCDDLCSQDTSGYLARVLGLAASRWDVLTFFASRDAVSDLPLPDPAVPAIRFDFPVPGYAVRVGLWQALLPSADEFAAPVPPREQVAGMLATNFQFTAGQMRDALQTARRLALRRDPAQPRLTLHDLYAGCRQQSARSLISLARLIEPQTDLTFDDLILPTTSRRQLDELRARIRHRGRLYNDLGFDRRLALGKGLIVLFTGTSGTGKTMAAELLAREQGVALYKVDLSAVVSKYVGETEKNLRRVFIEAEQSNAIVFFDEADALFGKRGEVKDARDRWANIEVNFLLQQVEEHAGVVILASNLRQNIDDAFLRRIHTIVEFPFPDATARFQILRSLFPTGLQRLADDDLQQVAERFRLTGGSLKNIVLDAGFRALAASESDVPTITLRHLVIAVGREYQKLGKPLTRSEFGDYYPWIEDVILLG